MCEDPDTPADRFADSLAAKLADRLLAAHEDAASEGPGHTAGGGDGPVVELAVGRRPTVAAALAKHGLDVVVTDLHDRDVPPGVTFVRDDLTDPDEAVYADATLLYARNLPAELQTPAHELAVAVDAPLYFTTLGAEEPVIPVDRETVATETAGTETLYHATDAPR